MLGSESNLTKQKMCIAEITLKKSMVKNYLISHKKSVKMSYFFQTDFIMKVHTPAYSMM